MTDCPNQTDYRTLQAASRLTRRQVLRVAAGASAAMALPGCAGLLVNDNGMRAPAAILRAGYDNSLVDVVAAGFDLIPPPDVSGKRVLLKPNLVDLPRENKPIVTDPRLLVAVAESLRSRGAREVVIADGPALQRDAWQIVDAIGLWQLLQEHGLRFVDINTADLVAMNNLGGQTGIEPLYYGKPVLEADVIISMPKMKAHHWAGVTLAMKNHFGMLSGVAHGTPRNQFHLKDLHKSVIDFMHTVRADYAIVDGIVGLEGDGPIRGTPIDVGVLVMGGNLPAVDATAARVMNVRPESIDYMRMAAGVFGPILEPNIEQRGESIAAARRPFQLLSHQGGLVL